ncbi:MAG: SIS domain-containing protein [Terracidiphilus sp.]|jgi:D-arabinose 5-phosphate isomerase GutQ
MSDNAQAAPDSPAGTTPGAAAETRLFEDILKQPAQLAASLAHMLGAGRPALQAAAAVLRGPSPVVIAAIGASWHAGMAMQAELLACGFPALLIDASELLHLAEVPRGAAVVLLSRSGKSTEIVQLIQKCRARSATIISITNQPDSPLAQGSDIVLHTRTDFDHAVSVTTYNAVGCLLFVYAVRFGKAIVVVPMVNGMFPLVTILVSLLLYRQIPGKYNLAGMVLALVAVLFMAFDEVRHSPGETV